MHTRSKIATLLVAATTVSLGLTATPAHADNGVTGGVTINNGGQGVIYQACNDVPESWTLSFPQAASDWDLSVDIIGPDGERADGDWLNGSDAWTAQGSATFLLCVPGPGTYTVRVTGTWDDSDYNEHAFTLPSSTFSMRTPQTRTTLKVSNTHPKRDQVVKMQIDASDERPAGYFPTDDAVVKLQIKKRAVWHTKSLGLDGITNPDGVTKFKMRWSHKRGTKETIRAITPAAYDKAASYSAPITLKGK